MDGTQDANPRSGRGRRIIGAAAAALLAALIVPTTAGAHGLGSWQRGMTEQQLRALETQLLGAEHAAEHAAMRVAERRTARGVVDPFVARQRRARALSAVGPPEVIGAWDGAPRTITRSGGATESMPAIHTILLPTGKVLMFGPPLGANRPRKPRANESVAVLFDPVTKGFEDVPPPIDPRTGLRSNIYCGGASLMADGRVLITGGYLDFDEVTPGYVNNRGLNHTWTFDPWTKVWERHENLGGGTSTSSIAGGRWYPTQTLMPDGRTIIVGGITETGTRLNFSVEVYDPTRPLGNELDTLTGSVTGVGAGGTDELIYPHMWWMPNGRGYVVGPAKWNSFSFPSPTSTAFTQIDAADARAERTWGTGVLQPLSFDSSSGRVTLIGGSSHPNRDDIPSNDIPGAGTNYQRLPATNTTENYDQSANSWGPGAALNLPRAHLNTVLLPDGKMVSVGGGAGGNNAYAFAPDHAERQVELFDGTRWTLGPAQAEGRAYHSTAVLLPDGSVISAGDDNPNPDDANPQTDTYEIYKPPYFFKGARPVITYSPPSAGYGSSILVGTTSPDIGRVALVAPGAATHAVDMGQRVINLPVTRRTDGTGYDVRTPANANVAPPGQYMVFLVDDQGRPSLASWIALAAPVRPNDGTGSPPAETAAPTVTARTPAAGATGVPVGDNVTATFSEDVQGVGDTTFTLRETTTGAAVAGVVTRNGTTNQWILDPSANLKASTSYTATLTGGPGAIRDAAGNALATSSWAWTTAGAAPGDTVVPTVTGRVPAPNSYDVHPATSPNVTFSEPVQNVTTATLNLRPVTASGLGAAVAATVTRTGTTNQYVIDPTANLATDTKYRVTLTGGAAGIRDLANNPLVSSTFDFLIGPRPSVTARSPGANAVRVGRTANVTATFSEPVLNVNATNVVLRNAATGAQVSAVVTYNAATRVATLNPNPTLAANTRYTVTLTGNSTSGIRDAAGNGLNTSLNGWSFTTGA